MKSFFCSARGPGRVVRALRVKCETCLAGRLGVAAGFLLSAMLPTLASAGFIQAPVQGIFQPAAFADSAPFYIHGQANKCIDAGSPETRQPGQPVLLFTCNQSTSQSIDIVEVNPAVHQVVIKASGYCFGPRGGVRNIGATLELQVCMDMAMEQRFAVDGDSIVNLADPPSSSPVFARVVIAPERGQVANGTVLAFQERNLADREFWTFSPVFDPGLHTSFRTIASAGPSSSARFRLKPTSGFIPVGTEAALRQAVLAPDGASPAAPGTVIEVSTDISLQSGASIVVPNGVTIRGGRRGAQPGAKITREPNDFTFRDPIFVVVGENARITGLRIAGPSTDRNPDLPLVKGILVTQDATSMAPASRTIIDHNEIFGFTHAAVEIVGGPDTLTTGDFCLSPRDYRLRAPNVQIVRNYLHHNRKQDEGYGVELSGGAHALIEANTFEENRHAITSTWDGRNEYYAYANLVMPAAPKQEKTWWSITRDVLAIAFYPYTLLILETVPDSWYSQDFDVHGSGPGIGYDFEDGFIPSHAGGIAGKYFDIGSNTFLGTNREALDLRGSPCLGAAFYRNVTRRGRDSAVTDRSNGNIIRMFSNQFSARDPAQTLGSGDFDGDGTVDAFMATGVAWYYRPAGVFEWRFLQYSDLTLDQIELRDADGDGRTDAVYRLGNQIFASWGASSQGDVIGEIPGPPPIPVPEPRIPPHGQRP
jgi:hypothetical protein